MQTNESRPLLLGHRGARPTGIRRRGIPPENTIAAFDYALAAGCDGFEFDVRYTRDRRCVLCHDPQLNHLQIALTNFSGLGAPGPPLLEEVLTRYRNAAYLDIELKVAGNEEVVVNALNANPPRRGYVVSSFLPEVLLRLHEIDSALPLGFICDHGDQIAGWRELPIATFFPHHSLLSKRVIDEAHAANLKLVTWTVNHRSDMLRLDSWGVDGLISDDPKLLAGTVKSG